MSTKGNSGISKSGVHRQSILDHRLFPAGIALLGAILVVLAFQFIEIFPDLSHLDVPVFSGGKTGNYYQTVERAAAVADKGHGRIRNVATEGSIDNTERLAAYDCGGAFALVQDGLPWKEGMELVARLTSPETVFFLGPGADSISSIGQLSGKRIGIGPKGSGTAHLAESLFKTPQLGGLKVTISYHGSEEQLELLKKGELDLGMFVISEYSSFMDRAVREYGMRIASFRQCESVARRLPFLKSGYLRMGFYDPVKNLPSSDRGVLMVDTLIVSNGKASRSQVMGVLSVFSGLFPGLVGYNRNADNQTGLPESPAARDFFNNQGPEVLDRYAPVLMDYIPVSGLVQLAMAVSVFFNMLGLGNRFRLWRIDANRVSLEGDIKEYFGESMLPEEIENLEPQESHREESQMLWLGSMVERLEVLVKRCRSQSQSMLVPMGAEMAYRYQEELISRNLLILKTYRQRLRLQA
ncbi:MAG: hypothetical protein JXA20_08740 [Spirochaetes bacterium]|nr:hypothetical protein [Spirochaetota bacterium]